MPAKNRKKTLLYSGLATGAIAILGLAAITPKEDRTVALVRGERLDVPSFVAPKSPKTRNSLIYIAVFLGFLSSGCSIGMVLVASKRQEELPKERQEYEIELEAQRRIAGANAARRVAVATNAAKMAADAEIEIYSNDLLGKFEAVAERSNWVALPEPEKPTKISALAEVEAQLQALEAKSREFDRSRLSPTNSPNGENEAEKKSTLSDDNVDTFGVSEIANQPVLDPGLLHPSEVKAREILNQLALSRKSLLLIAGTGGGKTVTQAALISILKEKSPKAEFWVVSQKNDNFCGLKQEGRVTIFDISKIKETLNVIQHVWNIYDARRHLEESRRKNLSPVRLLLADWFSISLTLDTINSHPDVKSSNYLSQLADFVLNGRDFNVCLWADLQSFNLKAIGMNADKNSRQNYNLIGLGNYYVDDEGVNESYGVLTNMIGERYMIASEPIRAVLLQEMERLKLISIRHQRPIIFSTLEPPSVCLQADIRHYHQQYQDTVLVQTEEPKEMGVIELQTQTEVGQESEIERLERIFKLSDSQENNNNLSGSQGQSDEAEPLSDKVSGFIWTVRGFGQMYPNVAPEQLFLSVSEAARSGQKPRDIIRSILKCGEKNDHATRSYTQHGKSLLKWLIENYDDGTIAQLPKIQEFLRSNPDA